MSNIIFFLIFVLSFLDLFKSQEFSHPKCGRAPSSNRRKRLVGDVIVDTDYNNNYKWHVLIVLNNKIPVCSGTLINEEWVISAASCLPKSKQFSYNVHIGSNIVQINSNNTFRINVKQIHYSPEYDPTKGVGYDLALLKLSRKLDFNNAHNYIRPLCLSMKGDPNPTTQSTCYTSSWINSGNGIGSDKKKIQNGDELRKLTMTFLDLVYNKQSINNSTCTTEFYNLIDKTICTTSGKNNVHSICQRDIGIPLQCSFKASDNQQVWRLVGVSSWGNRKCSETKKFNLFTDVSYKSYGEWISKITGIKLDK